MESHSIKKVTSRDGLAFEQFFDEKRRQLRRKGSTYIYYEIVGQIENWTALQVHEIPKGLSIKPDDFLAGITLELSKIYEGLKSPIDAIEEQQIIPSAELKSQAASQGITKMEDVIHLASAIQYQFTNNVWVVFVTFDEKDVLSHKQGLLDVCALRCSKPAYAEDHLVKLSRMKKPIQYYLNITNCTPQQMSFAKAVEQTLQVKIIR